MLSRVIVKNIGDVFLRHTVESLHFNAVAGVTHCEYPNSLSPETRMIVLSDAGDRTMLFSFVWTKHGNVTEGQTDRQTDRSAVAVIQRSALRTGRGLRLSVCQCIRPSASTLTIAFLDRF